MVLKYKRGILMLISLGFTLFTFAQKTIDHKDVYSIVKLLMQSEYKGVHLVCSELDKVSYGVEIAFHHAGDSVAPRKRASQHAPSSSVPPPLPPPPPPPLPRFAYSMAIFKDMSDQGFIDTADANFMFSQVPGLRKYELNPDLLPCKSFHCDQVMEFSGVQGNNLESADLYEQYKSQNFIKLTSPVFSRNQDKALISAALFKNGNWWSGTSYLLQKKGADWEIVYAYPYIYQKY